MVEENRIILTLRSNRRHNCNRQCNIWCISSRHTASHALGTGNIAQEQHQNLDHIFPLSGTEILLHSLDYIKKKVISWKIGLLIHISLTKLSISLTLGIFTATDNILWRKNCFVLVASCDSQSGFQHGHRCKRITASTSSYNIFVQNVSTKCNISRICILEALPWFLIGER